MADVFDGVPIEFTSGMPASIAQFRRMFGDGLTGEWDRAKWTLRKIALPEGAMTTWVSFQDKNGNILPDEEATWHWPDGAIRVPSDGGGRSNWVLGNQTWIDGGKTSGETNHYVGPYRVTGDGFEFRGIGWAGGTNHMKPAFYLQQVGSGGQQPPPVTPPPASGDAKADLSEAVSQIEQWAFKARDALHRLG